MFAKHRPMSLFASAVNPATTFSKRRKSLFVAQSGRVSASKNDLFLESAPEFLSQNTSSIIEDSVCNLSNPSKASPLDNIEVLRMIFDLLEEDELLLVIGVVSRKWSDAATHSHTNLRLSSVAVCDSGNGNNESTMISQRSWEYLTATFPWVFFLSEGVLKRVYKVLNYNCQDEEAISVL